MNLRFSICSALGSQMSNWTLTSLHLCQYFRQSVQGISHMIRSEFWLEVSRAVINSMIQRKPIVADRRYARIGGGY
jgi:hypothetical protein